MLVCLTANHHNATFDILERLAVNRPATAKTLVSRADVIAGAIIVATCNRFETYLDVSESVDPVVAADQAIEIFSDVTGIAKEELAASTATLSGSDVVPHLFEVSAGLKSVVIGEDEIAGQVRRSLEQARVDGTVTPELERLFQVASRTSRGVKTKTPLGHASRSLVRLGLELASSRIADWSATRILLIGTGQYAATTVAAVRDLGVQVILVYSPSGRAAKFAARLSLEVADSLTDSIAQSDVVITCTSNERPVVTPEFISAGPRRLIIDLGLPRNVDSEVAGITGIELLDLETIRLHAPIEELNATRDAHLLVDDAVAQFGRSSAERSTAGAVTALRRHIFGLLEDEVERSRRRGTWSQQSEADLRHLVGVLLHTPSVRARELARSGDENAFAEALSVLFGVDAEVRPDAGTGLDQLA